MKKKLVIVMAALLMLSTIFTNQKYTEVKAASEDVVDTVLMKKPPYKYYKSDKVSTKKNQAIKLKLKSSKSNEIVDKNFPSMEDLGEVPESVSNTWNDLTITKSFSDSTYAYAIYGGDYSEGYILNIFDKKTEKMVYSLDFSKYRYSPKYIKADKDYIQQKINWAAIKNNILYVSHSHTTYAKSSKNMNAYITAIDLSDMSILWRTKSLVSNSANFVIVNDVIISGYGFTDEPDYLYQIDMYTGKVLSKTALKTAASYIVKKGNALYVSTYNTNYIFSITE
jgi:hypothetical protein